MKVYAIKASADSAFKAYKKYRGAPPQSIYSLAAVTPDWVDFKLTDETSESAADLNCDADLVVIFMSTPDAMRGYFLADHYRSRGITVAFGGLHASFLPEEALLHGDSVMCGETEYLWPQLLNDFCSGELKAQYHNQIEVAEQDFPSLTHSDFKPEVYAGLGTVMVSRGCKFKCDFCAVHKFFPRFKARPVGQIVDEIKASRHHYFELHADNLVADRAYALELFEALKPLNITWFSEATLNFAEHDELLKAAKDSGLMYLLIGLETMSQDALKACGKGFVKAAKARELIKKLHDYKIIVDSAMIFGFDQHELEIFEETLEYTDSIELDVCAPTILTPFPGTDLFNRLDSEDRILTRDWSKYDCSHAVFQPARMTAQDLEQGVQWFNDQYFSTSRIAKRRVNHVKNIGWRNAAYMLSTF